MEAYAISFTFALDFETGTKLHPYGENHTCNIVPMEPHSVFDFDLNTVIDARVYR